MVDDPRPDAGRAGLIERDGGETAGLETFFLTGGFAVGAGEAYRALVAQAASEHAWSFGVDWNEAIVLAAPGEEPGLVGAGFYALAALNQDVGAALNAQIAAVAAIAAAQGVL